MRFARGSKINLSAWTIYITLVYCLGDSLGKTFLLKLKTI